MVKQPRAVRTRSVLVRAAAGQFDRDGYEGTSLTRVCSAAGISMGALTYHFPTKEKLADALQELGCSVTRSAVRAAVAVPASPLRRARVLILSVARLLEQETEVRAAARLARERHTAADDWTAVWLPELRKLLEQAYAEGQLKTTAAPETVAVMAAYLIAGVDAHVRRRPPAPMPGHRDPGAVGQLAQVWDLILHGVSALGTTAGTAGTTTGGAPVRG
jgi:AcrR family transcriptional regulator